MPKQYCVGAVEKAIKILNFLAEHPDSSFSEIFTALELSKSTTYQTLSTLEMFHYVERLDNRQYRLAMGILPLLRGIPKQNDIVEIRGIKIDKTARRVYVDGEEKVFTTKEFDLLTFLAENPNHVFTKDELFREIWDMDSVGDIATVTVHIKKIREKIEYDTSKPQYIETIWGVGYRFKV